ncbi:hypothetical protein PILCRDRAFT_805036, partial [Piloderma croceum F 1598]
MLAQLKLSLGAIYLGNFVAAIFYGITCFQTFTYYQLFARDRVTLKISYQLCRILDTLQMITVSYTAYVYAVSDWDDPVDLGVPLWTFWVNFCLLSLLVDADVDFRQAQVFVSVSHFLLQYHARGVESRDVKSGNQRLCYQMHLWNADLDTHCLEYFIHSLVIKLLLTNSDVYLAQNPLSDQQLSQIASSRGTFVLFIRVMLAKTDTSLRFYIIVLIVIAADIDIRAPCTQHATVPDLGIFAGLFAVFGQ